MFDLRKVHEYAVNNRTGSAVLVRENHYLRLHRQGEFPVFVQHGECFTEGGERLASLPPWVIDDLSRCTPEARRAVGVALPGDQGPTPAPRILRHLTSPPPVLPVSELTEPSDEGEDTDPSAIELEIPTLPAQWVCPDCGEPVPNRVKGVHIARHRRAVKRG